MDIIGQSLPSPQATMPATTEAIRAAIADFLNAERIATQAALDAAGGSIRVCAYIRSRVANCPADNMAFYNEVKEVLRALLRAE